MITPDWETRVEKATALSDKKRLAVMVEFLTEDHVDAYGGYPYDYLWMGDTLIVAELDDAKERNKTLLQKHTKKKLLKWFGNAVRLKSQHADFDWRDALYEAESRL